MTNTNNWVSTQTIDNMIESSIINCLHTENELVSNDKGLHFSNYGSKEYSKRLKKNPFLNKIVSQEYLNQAQDYLENELNSEDFAQSTISIQKKVLEYDMQLYRDNHLFWNKKIFYGALAIEVAGIILNDKTMIIAPILYSAIMWPTSKLQSYWNSSKEEELKSKINHLEAPIEIWQERIEYLKDSMQYTLYSRKKEEQTSI